ncbi:uncharacterized protein LOC110825061 isoform X1 [Carica papaya]|uniref:uncharacterized protein LOC110825061 isoform X1 n=1 Tax=Carica papaya TaxID=3649 RepID=UPI000B8C7EA9|nr:uncharacterized protein LOC110825061 isoform X1 [Carica papaya]
MAASVHMQSTVHDSERSPSFMATSPLFFPASDLRFGSALNGQIETLTEDINKSITGQCLLNSVGESETGQWLNENSVLLLSGFDSISHTLSQLSNSLDTALQNLGESEKGKVLNEDSMHLLIEFDYISDNLYQLSYNLDNALKGARDLAKPPPTLAQLLVRNMRRSEGLKQNEEHKQESKKGLKRKYDPDVCSNNQLDDSHLKKKQQS